MPRFSRFRNTFEQLAPLTPSTLTRLVEQQSKSIRPEPRYFQQFPCTVVHTDGSTFTLQSPLPTLPRIDLVKDTLMHPLWNPKTRDSELDANSEELVRFKRKFEQGIGGLDADSLSDLAFSEHGEAPVVIKAKVVAPAVQSGRKKK